MSTEKTQSAIREARDQLFIDTADGARLTTVSDNLGFSRPAFGFSNDDEWRALARSLALGPRQVELAFRKILDICVGPKFNRCGVVSTAVEVGNSTVTLEDASDLIQVGTLVLSPGQVTEETIKFCFVDRSTNKVFLESPVANAHPVLVSADAVLVDSVAPAATSLVVTNSSEFPVVYPYSICLGKGTVNEETVVVSNNDTGTNTLTVSATVNSHDGFKADYLRRTILNATVTGRTFLVLDILDTEEFPETGWVRLDAGEVTEEIVFYDENSVEDNILYLKTPLTQDHTALSSIELLEPGADVRTASVVQEGAHWSIFDTTHDHVKVLVPDVFAELLIQDASWLHDAVPAVLGSSTLVANTTATDTIIELASVANFPDEAGMLTIDGTERFFYTLRDEDATPNPTLTLTAPIGAIYPIGTTVELFEVPYAGTLLEEGNPRDAAGDVILDRFPGPYVFDQTQMNVGTVSTTTTSLHPPATELMTSTLVGRETLESKDLSLWASIAKPFQSRIGVGTGFEEELTVTDVTLVEASVGSVVQSGGASGTSGIVVSTTLAPDQNQAFPETVGAATAWFTIVLDEGNANEEFAIVSAETYAAGVATFTIARAWTTDPSVTTTTFSVTHSVGESVRLLNDVLTVDATTRQHLGPSVTPTVKGHPIEFLTDTISVASALGFDTTGGHIILNFGNSRISTRSRLNTIIAPDVYQFDDTSDFPTTDFPYQVILSQGTAVEELINVTANNTGLNQLTFSSTPANIHDTGPAPFGGYAAFVTGGMELIEYQDIDTNDIILNPAQVIGKHTVGEAVLASSGFSVPRADGFSYPFYLPPDRLKCVKDMFERVRAAGIQVTIIPF